MIIAICILLGLCFGSFVNAFVWRLRQKTLEPKKRKASLEDLSITKGRSMCVNCGHTLHTLDLLPVVSWVALRGRCRYCRKPISWQYPLVELTTAVLFVVSYIFWPYSLEGIAVLALGLWWVCLVGFMALLIYDIRWMLLPNKIIFPLYGVAALFVVVRMLTESSFEPLVGAAFGVVIGGGIFYALFQVSRGSWIGGGDVKLGFLLGALLGDAVLAGLALFIASLLGTVLAVGLMVSRKLTAKSRIPFGPFLIAATIIVQLFGQDIVDWYSRYFINI